MKFISAIRTGLAAVTSLGVALGLAACSRDYTVAYVYSISASTGTISAFAVDYQSGVLTQISGSPFGSQLSNPTTLVATPNGKFLYAIGGSQNSEVEELAIGTDGKLYGQNTYNLVGGSYPTAAAIDSAGAYLYVTFQYQTAGAYGPVSPGPGGVSIFKINSDNSLTSAGFVNVGNNPVGITVTAPSTVNAGIYVYVVDQEGSTFSPGALPTIVGFQQNTSTGALTLNSSTVYNSTLKTYQGTAAGVTPSAIASEPTGRFIYVSDKTQNEIFGYSIGGTGNLTAIVSSPYSTGLYPVSLTVDPRGKYIYTANFNSGTVSSFSINHSDGSLGGTAAVGNFTTTAQPTCVTIEPALGIYLYTSDYLDSYVSGGQLNPDTGQLTAIANTPFPTGIHPACIVSVANGSHASSLVNP